MFLWTLLDSPSNKNTRNNKNRMRWPATITTTAVASTIWHVHIYNISGAIAEIDKLCYL